MRRRGARVRAEISVWVGLTAGILCGVSVFLAALSAPAESLRAPAPVETPRIAPPEEAARIKPAPPPAVAPPKKRDVMEDVDQYLWAAYRRVPIKSDSSGDFTWKDPAAAKRM